MAKTIYLNNYSGLVFGYEVNTTVSSAEVLYDTAEPPNVIGTKVYPAALGTIQTNMLLDIAGVGQVVVTGTGSDAGGDFFTYSETTLPAAGAVIRTPWNSSGALRYTRENNTVSLTYEAATEHDLYFGTQKTSDSGLIAV